MNYILMILSSILGIVGTILDTHKEVRVNGRKHKAISRWGIVTVVTLILLFCLSIVKLYRDDLQAEESSRETAYLELSGINVGPFYYFHVNFKDSLFLTDSNKQRKEMRAAQKKEYDDYPKKAGNDSFALAAKPLNYNLSYFDSLSRNTLFHNQDYIDRSPMAILNFSAGILSGYINFYKDGHTVPMMRFDSSPLQHKPEVSTDSIRGMERTAFIYDKDQLTVSGRLERTSRAGTIYGSILRAFKKKQHPLTLTVFFDRKPGGKEIKAIDGALDQIEDSRFYISYDYDAYRWLIIKMLPISGVEFGPGLNGKGWILTKLFKYERLPFIGSKAED